MGIMKASWKAFLQNAGAEFTDDKVLHFGNPAQELQVVTTGSVMADLSYQGIISARGEDTVKFLQGQLTSDVRKVNGYHSQLSAYCSPKGRVLACMRIFKHSDAYFLQMPASVLESTLTRLRKYILFAKVALEDESDSLLRIGVSGAHTEQELRKTIGKLPEKLSAVVNSEGLTIIRLAGHKPRFEVIGDADPIEELWSMLNVYAAPVGTNAWSLLDIRAGIPNIFPETGDSFVPQMLNLDAIGAVSFQKGCYTGQEVVARTQYLGKLKRRLYRAHIMDNQAPVPGDPLVAANAEGVHSVGKVVEAQPSSEGGFELLAVVMVENANRNNVHIGSADGPPLEFLNLPYSLEPAK
jgi:folate-binding protein YgfZ